MLKTNKQTKTPCFWYQNLQEIEYELLGLTGKAVIFQPAWGQWGPCCLWNKGVLVAPGGPASGHCFCVLGKVKQSCACRRTFSLAFPLLLQPISLHAALHLTKSFFPPLLGIDGDQNTHFAMEVGAAILKLLGSLNKSWNKQVLLAEPEVLLASARVGHRASSTPCHTETPLPVMGSMSPFLELFRAAGHMNCAKAHQGIPNLSHVSVQCFHPSPWDIISGKGGASFKANQ